MLDTQRSSSASRGAGRDASSPTRIKRIAIVGGGTAGWVAASMLARALAATGTAITLIESPEIGTVGVGEATIPPIIDLLRFLSINEADFTHHTQATYKLGIKFNDWKEIGHTYWHPFGTFGAVINRRPFYHCWHKARAAGWPLRFNDYGLCAALGDAGKFMVPGTEADSPSAGLRYALHFDANLVARYLRNYAERLGVRRIERSVVGATRKANGFIEALQFSDHTRLDADLYIDCSGFRGVLIEQTLKTGYLDWTSILPCDRAVAFPTASVSPRPPFTQSSAKPAGWQWRIPLQHRVGNGYVYCSAHCTDDQALNELLLATDSKPLVEPRFLRFSTGRRKLYWNGNCIALGLASGFMEPLESTSIHLVTSGVYHLLEHFPDCDFEPTNIDLYNRELAEECERIRDFLVLHYCQTQRDDAPFWNYCRSMAVPESLQERIELYRGTGRTRPRAGELFTDLSWFYIFEGMGVRPSAYDPLVDGITEVKLAEILSAMARSNAAVVKSAPDHDSYFTTSGSVAS